MVWLSVALLLPLMLFFWALETKRTRINRYRSYGWHWRKIGSIYNVSLGTVRRWSMALMIQVLIAMETDTKCN